MKRTYTVAILAGLCSCLLAQVFFSMWQRSLAYDEVAYIPAGYSYVGWIPLMSAPDGMASVRISGSRGLWRALFQTCDPSRRFGCCPRPICSA